MSGSRSKKLRRLLVRLPDDTLQRAAADGHAAWEMENSKGERQHLRVNLARRLRKKVAVALADKRMRAAVEKMLKHCQK